MLLSRQKFGLIIPAHIASLSFIGPLKRTNVFHALFSLFPTRGLHRYIPSSVTGNFYVVTVFSSQLQFFSPAEMVSLSDSSKAFLGVAEHILYGSQK